jgi:hypothetical protein
VRWATTWHSAASSSRGARGHPRPVFLQHKTVGEGFEKEGLAVPLIIQRAHRLLDEGA